MQPGHDFLRAAALILGRVNLRTPTDNCVNLLLYRLVARTNFDEHIEAIHARRVLDFPSRLGHRPDRGERSFGRCGANDLRGLAHFHADEVGSHRRERRVLLELNDTHRQTRDIATSIPKQQRGSGPSLALPLVVNRFGDHDEPAGNPIPEFLGEREIAGTQGTP